MSQPLDRDRKNSQLGELDREAGELFVENPFDLIADGHNWSAYERNRLFINNGGTEFLDVSFASGCDIDADSRSAIVCDFNGDTAPDLLVGSVGGGPLRLFLNRFPRENHWLRLWLRGTKSNVAGIGSRITVEFDGKTIVRDLFPANGCLGAGPAELSIGVGKAMTVDRLTVRWPSGDVQTLENVPVSKHLIITEGGGWQPVQPTRAVSQSK